MSARRALVRVLTVLALASWTVPAEATAEETFDRLYLMGADTDYLYWSVDPADPEIAEHRVVRRCGTGKVWGTPGTKPCVSFMSGLGTYSYILWFAQASLLDETVRFNPNAPSRIHLEMEVSPSVGTGVQMIVQAGTRTAESGPLSEVRPGVWEGDLQSHGWVDPGEPSFLGVWVTSESPGVTLSIGTGGPSYVELDAPIRARSVPALLTADTYRPDSRSLATPQRHLWFNDGDWRVTSHDADTGSAHSFELDIDRKVETLLVWAEAYDTPFLHDVLRGRPADAKKLTDTPVLDLYRGDEHVGWGKGEEFGRGTDALALVNVEPDTYRLEATPARTSQGMAYRIHVLEVFGKRTLARMRWMFANAEYPGLGQNRTPLFAFCGGAPEPVPVTSAVTTFHVNLDWDTYALPSPAWTLGFDIPNV
ncbi:MAG: hypothetical protein M3245_02540, partial [Actinomycetota bacterium]|nr:hypothetical protein [Actinomycetota bacterium]